MEWTQLACLLAGCFVGSFLMTVWQNERRYQRRVSPGFENEAIRLADGWWFPPSKSEPPPAPPAP